MHGDELADGHLWIKLDHREPACRLLNPNSSAPPALLRPDADADTSDDGGRYGPSSQRSTLAAADTNEGTLQYLATVTADRRLSLLVKGVGLRERFKGDRRRKSCDHVAWNLDHEAELARKVVILYWLSLFSCAN